METTICEPMKKPMMPTKWRREDGSLTMEAALSFGVFFLAVMTWFSFLLFLRMEARTRHAIRQAALSFGDQWTKAQAVAVWVGGSGIDWPGVDFGDGTGGDTLAISSVSAALGGALDRCFAAYDPGIDTAWIARPLRRQWQVDFEPSEQVLYIGLRYEAPLPGLLRFLPPLVQEQRAVTGVWFLPEAPRSFGSGEEEEGADSPWQWTPWKRGRYYARKWRDQGEALKPGRLFDRYVGGHLETVRSIQLFSPSYASGEGENPQAYVLRTEVLQQRLRQWINEIRRAGEKWTHLQWADGRSFPMPQEAPARMVIIVPQEAQVHAATLDALCRQAEAESGVSIVWVYRDAAWPKEAP